MPGDHTRVAPVSQHGLAGMRATRLVEQVPLWLLRQVGLPDRIGAGRRRAAVYQPPGVSSQPTPACYHLNMFSWGPAWRRVANRQKRRTLSLRGETLAGAEPRDAAVGALRRIPPRMRTADSNTAAGKQALAMMRKQAGRMRRFVHASGAMPSPLGPSLPRGRSLPRAPFHTDARGRALQEVRGAGMPTGARLPGRSNRVRKLGGKGTARGKHAGGVARSSRRGRSSRVGGGDGGEDEAACASLASLGVRSILFVGDSFIRQLFLATLLLLVPRGHSPLFLAPVTSWAPSTRGMAHCTAQQVATSADSHCRHDFARSTAKHLDAVRQRAICAGRVSLEFVYGGIKQTAATGAGDAEFPGIDVAAPADLVVLGYGIWDSFSTEAVQRRIQRHLTAVERWRSAAPRLVFLASDSRHRNDFGRQMDGHVVAFNSKMARARARALSNAHVTHSHTPTRSAAVTRPPLPLTRPAAPLARKRKAHMPTP